MGFLDSIFGSKPSVPKLERTSLTEQQTAAVGANIAATKDAGKLADLTQAQIDKMLAKNAPNLFKTLGKGWENIDKMVSGELPISDVNQSWIKSIAKSLGSGQVGARGKFVARDLGLSQLAVTQQGLNTAMQWVKGMESLYNPAMQAFGSMFITPQQLYTTENEQNVQQFQRNWMKEQAEAQPDPLAKGLFGLGTSVLGSAFTGLGGWNAIGDLFGSGEDEWGPKATSAITG